MNLFIQLLFNGLSIGCSIAIIAVSFGLIYSTSRTFHIAHSVVFVSSAYLAYFLFTTAKFSALLTLMISALWSIVLGMGIYYFFYKPIFMKSGSGLVVFITSLALTIISENFLSLLFKADPKQLPQNILTNPIKFNSLTLSLLDITTILYAILVLVIIIYFLNGTKIGRMTKATSSDPELAISKGIDIEKIYLFTYGLGSLLVMPAGILIGLRGSITPGMGSSLNMIGVMSVIFGGIGNPIGAFIAAIILGLIRNISLLVIDSSWISTLTFGIFLLVILIQPKGIMGDRSKN